MDSPLLAGIFVIVAVIAYEVHAIKVKVTGGDTDDDTNPDSQETKPSN